MAPTQISKTLRESESTAWVPLKCKYLTIGSYHQITPADIIKCNDVNPFLRARPKSFTISTKDLVGNGRHIVVPTRIEAEKLILPIFKPIEKVTVQEPFPIIVNNVNNGICTKDNRVNVKEQINNVESKNIPLRSNYKHRNSKKAHRQPIKNLCCCWSIPKNKQLSDSGGPTEGQRVPDSSNVVTGTDALSRNNSSRGSLRKVLPSVPDMDQQLSMAAKMIDRRTSTPKGAHSYGPYFLEYTLLAEYNLLQAQRLGGVYVVPSANSPLVWFGVIFLRQGPYQEGIFRFSMHIPENYPDGDVPSVIFESKIFHPLIDPETGELDVKRGFANKWKRNVNHLWHVLSYIRKSFYKIETSQPSNPEAAVLYTNENQVFQSHVQGCVTASKDNMYEPPCNSDPHAIIFSPYQPAVHDQVNQELKKERTNSDVNEKELSSKGLSWVKNGTMQIFSKSAS